MSTSSSFQFREAENDAVELHDGLLIGTGLHRRCYEDPRDRSRCIKVVFNGDQTETRRERHLYRQLHRRNTHCNCIPEYFGTVQTSVGEGSVFSLIRDYDGPPSRTLENALADADSGLNRQVLLPLVNELRRGLIANAILTMTIKPTNIVVQKLDEQHCRLVIVDNLGCSEGLPVSSYVPFFARLKTARRFARFEERLWEALQNMELIV